MADWQKWNEPHYIYVAYRADEALYVGCTWDPVQRLENHSHSEWLAVTDRVDIFGPFPKVDALEYERHAIWNLQPTYNKKGKTRKRETLEWADAAWAALADDAEQVTA